MLQSEVCLQGGGGGGGQANAYGLRIKMRFSYTKCVQEREGVGWGCKTFIYCVNDDPKLYFTHAGFYSESH